MPTPPSICLRDVTLRYRVREHRGMSLKEYTIHWVRERTRTREILALRDVNLLIEGPGRVGFVGANGAGKTTLLKVIAGVLKPQHGVVELQGTVAPILSLGAGFDHELSGRENILLNSLLLGHTRREAREEQERIIAFSELDRAIDSPLKTYSSGMAARLAFSIATAWRPDILILDEVLAVGDIAFQQRCSDRIQQLVDHGTLCLLVNHSPTSLARNCDRVIWLDHGTVRDDGPTERILERYLDSMSTRQTAT